MHKGQYKDSDYITLRYPPRTCPSDQNHLFKPYQLTASLKRVDRTPQSHSQQHRPAQRKDLEPEHNGIARGLYQTVHNPGPNIRPSQCYREGIVHLKERQAQGDSIEDSWLLVEMIVIVRRVLSMPGNVLVELRNTCAVRHLDLEAC